MNEPPARRSRIAVVLLWLAAFWMSCATGLPSNWPHFKVALDESWHDALHVAWRNRTSFGDELLFTYGPWGFVLQPVFHPATMPVVLLARILLCAAVAAAATGYVLRQSKNGVFGFLWLIAAHILSDDSNFTTLLLLVLLWWSRDGGPPRPLDLATAVAAAFLGMAKFTYLMLGLAMVGLIAIDDLRRRRFPMTATVYVTAAAAIWISAGQSLAKLPEYLRRSLEIASGYTEAMSNETPWPPAVAFVAAAALLAAAVLFRERSVLKTMAFLAIGFMLLKACFVRGAGQRDVEAFGTLGALAMLYDLRCSRSGRAEVSVCAALLLCVAAGTPLIRSDFSITSHIRHRLEGLSGRASFDAARKAFLPRQQLEAEFGRNKAAVFPFVVDADGPIDVYPHHQTSALLAGRGYRHRPVFQSYQTYTGQLAEWNAEFLRGPDAPPTILFLVEPVDRRFPALDDGLSWPELISRYDVDGRVGPFLRLRKTDRPRKVALRPLRTIKGELGLTVRIAGGESATVWAKIDLRPTLLQRLATFLYKTPRPTLTINDRYTTELVPSLARAGFLLSPVVDGTETFARFAVGQPGTNVESIRIDAEPWLFEAGFSVELQTLEMVRQP